MRAWMVMVGVLAACAGRGAPEAAPRAVVAEPEVVEVPVADAAAAIAAALASPDRPDEDRARDADRRPAEVLAFLGFEPGMVVADVMSGRGYYTELLARAVGPTSKVYAQNNAFVLDKFAREALDARLAHPGLDAVVRVEAELEGLGLPEGQVDLVWMGLFFHDTYWMQADRTALLASVMASLRPGGVFGLSDHHAEAGSGDRDVKTLHRVDRAVVLAEIEAAGFVLEAESDLLRNPGDDRTVNVFDDAIRGRTDRFLFKFRKPVP